MNSAAVLGLAALLQSLFQIKRLAHEGTWDETQVAPLVESLFHLDAVSAEEVYGGVHALGPGLALLGQQLQGRNVDSLVARMAATILHLERKLIRHHKMMKLLATHIRDAERARDVFGAMHENIYERMSETYVDTLSKLSPRVMVQGQPEHLTRARIVVRIRTLLLAAVRGAVLWRQSGGNGFRLFWKRQAIIDQAQRLLGF